MVEISDLLISLAKTFILMNCNIFRVALSRTKLPYGVNFTDDGVQESKKGIFRWVSRRVRMVDDIYRVKSAPFFRQEAAEKIIPPDGGLGLHEMVIGGCVGRKGWGVPCQKIIYTFEENHFESWISGERF